MTKQETRPLPLSSQLILPVFLPKNPPPPWILHFVIRRGFSPNRERELRTLYWRFGDFKGRTLLIETNGPTEPGTVYTIVIQNTTPGNPVRHTWGGHVWYQWVHLSVSADTLTWVHFIDLWFQTRLKGITVIRRITAFNKDFLYPRRTY